MARIFNFSAGPATLPLQVIEKIREDLPDYYGEGMSLIEMSHRSRTFDKLAVDAEQLIRDLMGFSNDYQTLFLQGGATGQFAALVLNLSQEGKTGEYVDTGSWSKKAIQEAEKLGKPFRVVASSKESNYNHIPTVAAPGTDAAYYHITSNNTIFGTQWETYPDTGNVPLICDMSSDFYCRRFNPDAFSLIYAGAQKNAGPSGVTMVIIRKALLERSPSNIPTIFNYRIFAEKNSLYNTPNTFGIYVVKLVMEWIRDQGGVDAVEKVNRSKAKLLYDTLDDTGFYSPHAEKSSRSLMNVTWRCPNEDLDKKFIAAGLKNGFSGLKGHRSVGGVRASIYNAMPESGVAALVDFMKEFERQNG